MFNMEWNSYLVSVKSVILLQLSNISVKTSKESQYFVGTELGWFEVFFLQSYHSMPSYTWFEPILTPLWSSYLVWTILTNKLILIFVLRDGLKFFWTIISFTAILHVVWVYFDTIMILLSCLNNFNQQTHLNFRSNRWLEVLLDNYIIHCHPTRGLSLFWHHFDHPFFAGKV